MIAVYKAQAVRDEKVADLNLVATKPFPEFATTAEHQAALDVDAQFVVSALLASLPGGTVDAVLRGLLQHRASLLRVRWPEVSS
jgi:hypothetical protein